MYAPYPCKTTKVSQRYFGLDDIYLSTYSPAGFVAAKTVAWSDDTRNAPRDLYDLWALAEAGYIDAEAAHVYKKYGPTGKFPTASVMPRQAPSEREWFDSLAHQCLLKIPAEEAFTVVMDAWETACDNADAVELQ